MEKLFFMVKRFLVGFLVTFEPEQSHVDFLITGARKACLINGESIKSFGLFTHFFYDFHTVYTNKVKENPELKNYPSILVTKKGLKISNVVKEDDGMLLIDDLEMGILLGYPPKECKEFRTIKEQVAVDYHGVTFVTESSRLAESIDYMEQTFKLPKFMKTGIHIR